MCAQEEIQREMEEEDQVQHQHKAQQDAHNMHQPTPQVYKTPNEPYQAAISLGGDLINHGDPLYPTT